jgi:hypothetical protein
VRVEARVKPTTTLSGSWNVFVTPEERGAWRGANVKVTETWQPGPRTHLRIRGRASGGPRRVHYVQVKYLKSRTGEGNLIEALMDTDRSKPLELQCAAQGSDGPGDTVVEAEQTAMQVVDDPRRNRVTVQGPGIAFLGPECRPAGQDRPIVAFGLHPPDEERNFEPEGAITPVAVHGAACRVRGRRHVPLPRALQLRREHRGADHPGRGRDPGHDR